MIRAYTDYPILELGDIAGEEAPIRQVKVLYYDQDKRCKILVEGIETHVKHGYLYKTPGRCGEVESINTQYVKNEKGHYKSSKAAQITRSWNVYPANYKPGDGYHHYRFLKDAWNKACSLGIGSEVVSNLKIRHKDGGGVWTSGDIVYEVTPKQNKPTK